MRRRLRTPLVRLAILALLATTAGALAPSSSTPAAAATMVRECKTTSVSCLSFSGYTGKSVWGYPVNAQGNNCVNYAAYRLAKNGVKQQSGMGNGGNWAAAAKARGYRVDQTPAVGAIAQWGYNSHYAPGYGHVGYVEEVTSTYLVISDSAWSGYSSRWRIPKGDANWPSNFIHFKDVAYQPPPSGAYLRVRETNEVYRLVGSAPVHISTWTGLGGTQPTHLVSSTTLGKLPARPVDGRFIRGAQRGEVFRIVGGAPVIVTTWSIYGGTQPTTTVDQNAIDKAGTGGKWNHLRNRPAEGTIVRGIQRKEVYRIAGGAPVFVHAWENIGGYRAQVLVDQLAIDRAGSGGKYNHLAFRPLDGSYVKAVSTGTVYAMKGGVAHALTSWTQVGGPKPTIGVDHVAIAKAGVTSPIKWTHVKGTTSY